MTEAHTENRYRKERDDLSEQLTHMQNLAEALVILTWDLQQAPDIPEHLHRHRDALIGISDAMQRVVAS